MLYTKFESLMDKYPPISNKFVLALSGGIDSRVMLDLISRYISKHSEYTCKAVYINHGLSSNADYWGEKCQEWSNSSNIQCAVERVKLNVGSGQSIEQEARNARYQALNKYITDGDCLITAQHSDDQVETFLLALKRGSGTAGLASMPRQQSFGRGYHFRPLLDVPRHMIEKYAYEHKLEWIEDESNKDTRYDRNFIRHEVKPLLEQRWPGINKAICRSASLCADQENLVNELLLEKYQKAITATGGIRLEQTTSKPICFALIRMFLKNKNKAMPSKAQMEHIWGCVIIAKDDANPKFCWMNNELRRHKGVLFLVEKCNDVSKWQSNISKRLVLPDELGTVLIKHSLDGNIRQPNLNENMNVRFTYVGDEIKPVGRSHSRKYKKLMQEYNVPSWLRNRTPMLFYNDKLVSIANLFVVDEFKSKEDEIGMSFDWHDYLK